MCVTLPSWQQASGTLGFAASEQLSVFVKRPYLLLLLPVGLAIGYGTGRITLDAPGSPPEKQEASLLTSEHESVYQQKRDIWRKRFLKIIEEPSFSLQSASYYAVAKDLSVEEMPYFLEGMYPEGWTRFRGDLPLAVFMEWAKRDSSGLALFTERLFREYPDLHDNLDGVYFNLGLQNAPGTIDTIAKISSDEAKRFIASQFFDGLNDEHPEQLFTARFQIHGPQDAFSNVTNDELDQAVEEFWSKRDHYISEQITPNTPMSLELGKRYHDLSIQLLNTTNNASPAIVGSIIATGTASPETVDLLSKTWFNWRDIENYISEDEKRTLLTFLIAQENYWRNNQSGIGPGTIAAALDRETIRRLIDIPELPTWTQSLVLSKAAKLYSRHEYLQLLKQLDESGQNTGLHSFISSGPVKEGAAFLAEIPSEWRTPQLINSTLEKALLHEDIKTFEELCAQYPEHQQFLPDSHNAANALWEQDPELYLSNIEMLDDHSKERHLVLVASLAAEEEVGMILESGTFEQQTDVLINLIHTKPELSTEILKHEDPRLIGSQQAAEIGVSLSYRANPETTLSYFQASDLSHTSSQITALNFCLSESFLEEGTETSQQISKLSSKHNYIYRTANAFAEETENPERLLALRNEDPETFLNVLTSQIERTDEGSLRRRAKHMLSTSTLSPQEKLAIHNALYGNPKT